eukprot:scaffold6456_cov98-Isochrysis_galbana.AAC.8
MPDADRTGVVRPICCVTGWFSLVDARADQSSSLPADPDTGSTPRTTTTDGFTAMPAAAAATLCLVRLGGSLALGPAAARAATDALVLLRSEPPGRW